MELDRLLRLAGVLTEASRFYNVFVKDEHSKVIPDSDEEAYWALLDDDWELVWDSAPSLEAGINRAAQFHGAWPEGHTDSMQPQRMQEPKVLYRSVSLPELVHIYHMGGVSGGQNVFNDFDQRRYVFFGDKINDQLTHQGEEIERQAAMAVRADYEREFQHLAKTMEKLRNEMVVAAKRELPRMPRYVRRTEKPVFSDEDFEQWAMNNRGDLGFLLQDSATVTGLRKQVSALRKDMEDVGDRYRAAIREKMAELKTERAGQEVTSAVIETRPIKGGLHYSKAHGKSGMGDDDEYGFAPNQVTTDDITRVHWVKNKAVIGTTPISELGLALQRLDLI